MAKVQLLLDVVQDVRSLADSLEAVADAMLASDPQPAEPPKPKMEPTPTPIEKPIPIEAVRAVLLKKSQAGKTAEIQKLLRKHGAPKLSEIDPSHYKALLADAEVL